MDRHKGVHPFRALSLSAALVPLTALVACGDDTSSGTDNSSDKVAASTSYQGPLHLPEGEGRHPRAGAAGDVVDCDAWGMGGVFHGDVYYEGATADTPDDALEAAFSEGLFLSLPKDLAVAAESGSRVLYVAEVAEVPKAAVIVHEGSGAEGAGGDGWYLESWASCDVVELPAAFVEQQGYEVWTDADGRVVPTRVLEVFRGAEHCDWQDMTFLSIGGWDGDGPSFARKPHPELRQYFAEPYRAHTTLPADAVDSGFRRGEDRLWLAADRSRAYVGAAAADVELWPRMVRDLGCA